jgi:hypothetical protein
MNAKRLYFRTHITTELGKGVAYMEFTDGRNSRVIEMCGATARWGDIECPEHLIVEPLSECGFRPDEEIEPEEFERAWKAAQG